MRESAFVAFAYYLSLPLGIGAGLAWGWWRGADTAAFIRWGAAGGLLGGVATDVMASMALSDSSGHWLFPGLYLGPTLGTILGLALGVGVAICRLARRVVRRHARTPHSA